MGKPKPSLSAMKKQATTVPKGLKGGSSSSKCKRDQERSWTLKGLRVLGAPLVALLVNKSNNVYFYICPSLTEKVVKQWDGQCSTPNVISTPNCHQMFLQPQMACLGSLHARFHGICTTGPGVGQREGPYRAFRWCDECHCSRAAGLGLGIPFKVWTDGSINNLQALNMDGWHQ